MTSLTLTSSWVVSAAPPPPLPGTGGGGGAGRSSAWRRAAAAASPGPETWTCRASAWSAWTWSPRSSASVWVLVLVLAMSLPRCLLSVHLPGLAEHCCSSGLQTPPAGLTWTHSLPGWILTSLCWIGSGFWVLSQIDLFDCLFWPVHGLCWRTPPL